MTFPSRRALLVVYLACGVGAGVLSFALGQSKNLEVFRHASMALLASRDLYDGSSVDWFKYSPTFALLFLPVALLPRWLAAAVWGALNFGAAYGGIVAIGRDGDDDDDRRARTALLAALPGVLLATDGDQANLLVAGTMLGAFAAFERGRSTSGAVLVAVGAFVKLFPVAAVLFALPHRDRERSFFRTIIAAGAGLVLPLLVISPATLTAEYGSWLALLRADHANLGWSLVTVVRSYGGSATSSAFATVSPRASSTTSRRRNAGPSRTRVRPSRCASSRLPISRSSSAAASRSATARSERSFTSNRRTASSSPTVTTISGFRGRRTTCVSTTERW